MSRVREVTQHAGLGAWRESKHTSFSFSDNGAVVEDIEKMRTWREESEEEERSSWGQPPAAITGEGE